MGQREVLTVHAFFRPVMLAKPNEIVLQKVIISCVRSIFSISKYIMSLPRKITPEIQFSKPYSEYSLFF